ncbi:MAG: hypothetical protein ACXVPY_02225 [Bacteroidia bacterium]
MIELDTDGHPFKTGDQKTNTNTPAPNRGSGGSSEKKEEPVYPPGKTPVKDRKITAADTRK